MNSNIILGYGYKDLARMVRKNKILSSYARDYGCYQYWQSGKTKYNCIKNFCNTTQINAIQGQETVCKAIEAQIKIKVLNQKELFYQDMKEFDIYNIEYVKQYLSPTILSCFVNEECETLLKFENKGFNIIEYNNKIKVELLQRNKFHTDKLLIIDEYYYNDSEPELGQTGSVTSIKFIKKGYLEPYGNGIIIDKLDYVINGTLAYNNAYFCAFKYFNMAKLLKCYRL